VNVVWRPAARDDRQQIFEYLFDRNPEAAREIETRLILAADSLTTFPHRGRPGKVAGTRELLTVWPYVLVYEVDDAVGLVRILRIWHGAQNRSEDH
jgi:toxin ParE1/3/4